MSVSDRVMEDVNKRYVASIFATEEIVEDVGDEATTALQQDTNQQRAGRDTISDFDEVLAKTVAQPKEWKQLKNPTEWYHLQNALIN
jgi:hypothetical protein